MKKIYIHLMMLAAMVVAGAAMVSCSKEEVATGKFKMSINATMAGGNSKALSLNGTTLNATWAEGEVVTVSKGEYGEPIGTLTAQSAGESTTLDGEISGTIAVGDMLTLKFCSPNYASQQGTLEYIAANCDYAEAAVRVASVDDGVVQIEQGIATFVNQQSIVKFSLVDEDGSTPLSTTKLVVNDGTNDYTVTPTAGTSEFWVAIPDIDGQAITLYADINPYYIYYKTTNGVTFHTGQYYEVTVKMSRYGIDLARVPGGANITALDGDVITGTLPSGFNSLSISNGAMVTLRNASITGEGLTCAGNATIMLDGTNTVNAELAGVSGIYVPNSSTLTIGGSGSLTVRGDDECSGIGGKNNAHCGNITIVGGTIIAYGGDAGAGIGSGRNYYCGDITIMGGNVTAFGGAAGSGGGAGIGCGHSGKCTGSISITGGVVNATGGSDGGTGGAGIGGGYKTNNTTGSISITGGTVTATGGVQGAGIGGGYGAKWGTIEIASTVTSVTAIKGGTYSIGKGDGSSSCGTVTIGGVVYNDGITTSPYTYTPNN